MNEASQARIADRIRRELDDAALNLPEGVAARLAAGRQAALGRVRKPARTTSLAEP